MKTTVYGVICALLLAALLHAVPAVGQTDAAQSTSIASHKGGNVYQPVTQHHELRIGWGDMMFETLVWHDKTLLPNANSNIIPKNYRYTQHWFAEYLYHLNFWFSFGGMVDYGGVYWDNMASNGTDDLQFVYTAWFANIAMVPTIRFTYYDKDLVRLYSALGYGININTGTEVDYKGRTTACAGVLNLTLLGVSVGNEHVFGSVELGGTFSMANKQEINLLDSRIFTASVGVRF